MAEGPCRPSDNPFARRLKAVESIASGQQSPAGVDIASSPLTTR